jgi:hypothetical protein
MRSISHASSLLMSHRPEIEKHTRSQSTHRPPAMSTSSSSRSSASSHESLPSISEDLTDLLFVTCELANVTAAKVVSYRSEQHSQLDLPQFIDFFNTSWSFVMRCEVLSRKMIVGLRSTVLGHVSGISVLLGVPLFTFAHRRKRGFRLSTKLGSRNLRNWSKMKCGIPSRCPPRCNTLRISL